jgi:hypothetical protein
MSDQPKPERERRFCPYCDEELTESALPYCQPCKVEVFYCPVCRKPMPREKRVCPHCGADIKAEKT